ncbi:glycosyl hydrolase family 28-related protein [Xanthobacter sp. AM11]|uniref:glycosyl hydrolase family 28-related protein n=1 Tax=Xanthobacter sp. AM11 TaxID=3380643 RepID=UPI0039BFC278
MAKVLLMIAYFILNVAFARDVAIVLFTLPIFAMILFFSTRETARYLQPSDVIWLCFYLFFVIVPIQSFDSGYFDFGRPTTGIYFSYWEVASAFAIVGIFILVFGTLYSERVSPDAGGSKPHVEVSSIAFIVFILLAMVSFVGFIGASGGLGSVLAPRNEKTGEVVVGVTTVTLACQVVFTQIAFAAWLQTRRFGLVGLSLVILLFLIMAVSQNPFNTARFFLISTWVPIVLIALRGRVVATTYYIVSFFAIIIIMPILSLTTRVGNVDLSETSIFDLVSNAIQLQFMDVFDTLCALVSILEDVDYNYGHKTLSLIFFFIPRAVWAAKATLTGLDVGEYLYFAKVAGTANLSMFVAGDFYADLGFIGVAIGAASVALFVRWFFIKRAYLIAGQSIKAYIFIAFLPILIRGPLGATVGLIFVELLVLSCVTWVLDRAGRATKGFGGGGMMRQRLVGHPVRRTAMMLPLVVAFLGASVKGAFADAPVVFWASDPVTAGEIAFVAGADFGEAKAIEVRRLSDAPNEESQGPSISIAPLEVSDASLKVRIPPELGAGVYEVRLASADGSVKFLLNAPTIYWVHGDQGQTASPGGWLRIMGRNIVRSGQAYLSLVDPTRHTEVARLKPVDGGLWDAQFTLPADLADREYEVQLWNGQGDAAAVRSARIVVRQPDAMPATTISLRDFGAVGDGLADDMPAVERALAQLRAQGGGTLFVPRGVFHLSGEIKMPRKSRLRGEDRELSVLMLKNQPSPPEAFISGESDFSIENLTILAANHWHIISGGLSGDISSAKNIKVDSVTIRASFYREHLKPDRILERYLKSISVPGNGPDAIRMRGDGISIENSDIYSSVRSIFIPDSKFIIIRNNKINNGRRGWYSISRSSEIIFEGNAINGADLQASGGGINTLYGEKRQISRNVIFKGNDVSNFNGMDGEAMTADGPGGCYWGAVRFRKGQNVADLLPAEGTGAKENCDAGALMVVDGRGKGAFALVQSVEARSVHLDRVMTVDSGEDTIAVIVPVHMRYLGIGNRGIDTGTFLQSFGGALEQVFADNKSVRSGGYSIWAGEYGGYPQASFYSQMIRNQTRAGYYSGLYIYKGATSLVRVYNDAPLKYLFPLVRGIVIRGNQLEGNANIYVGSRIGRAVPSSIVDVIVEGNRIAKNDVGIEIGRGASGVLIDGNHFDDVRQPILDLSLRRVPGRSGAQ